MKKRLLILLLALLMIPSLAATAEVSLPEGLTEIGAYAFEGDSALKGRVVLPDGVQTVAAGAFAGTRVHALVLPDGCTAVSGSVLAPGSSVRWTMLPMCSAPHSASPPPWRTSTPRIPS